MSAPRLNMPMTTSPWGAISLPVLDDAERAEVGTIYKQVSPLQGAQTGPAALVARNAATRTCKAPWPTRPARGSRLVNCWRGGQRSGSFASILAQIGWRVDTIAGGYKSWRALVVKALCRCRSSRGAVIADDEVATHAREILEAGQRGQTSVVIDDDVVIDGGGTDERAHIGHRAVDEGEVPLDGAGARATEAWNISFCHIAPHSPSTRFVSSQSMALSQSLLTVRPSPSASKSSESTGFAFSDEHPHSQTPTVIHRMLISTKQISRDSHRSRCGDASCIRSNSCIYLHGHARRWWRFLVDLLRERRRSATETLPNGDCCGRC